MTKPWFVLRKNFMGVRPVSREGWAATGTLAAAIVAANHFLREDSPQLANVATAGLIGLFVVMLFFTTAPRRDG